MIALVLVFIVGLHAGYTNWTRPVVLASVVGVIVAAIAWALYTYPYATLDVSIVAATAGLLLVQYLGLSALGYVCGRWLNRYNTKHHGGA